ncbi:hypothetical protein HDG34_005875 [Paraburkholderia sp. HC6.4b]|uniref:hypothetical protein n=1 Tax=unclassified Paraburkholderia TaxID=2615204 RepID=UPI00161DEB1C|nr:MULTISPECIES: hypothetical protein [unclassified Paraburkholderia]MBB5411909.1 hypothetical protein [Paraburkholderia sp. HC6.4b]MBB5450221.1 hypothetical protein [Paraburkholderia sp. Kb1A]
MIQPIQDSYTLTPTLGSLVTTLPGGMPRVMQQFIRQATPVQFTIVLNSPAMVQWFQNWWEFLLNEGSMPFVCALAINTPAPINHVAVMTADPQYSVMLGYYAEVVLTVAAEQVLIDRDLALGRLLLWQIYGDDAARFLNILAQFANVDTTVSLGRIPSYAN